MSDDKHQSQKTELPTQKRLDDAHRKGDSARAQEMRHAAMFGGASLVAAILLGLGASALMPMMQLLLGDAQDFDLSPGGAHRLTTGLFGSLAVILAPIFGALVVAAILGGLLSGRPTLAWKRVKPDWSKLSPAKGLKRLFGMQGLVEFLKTAAKFVIVTIAAIVAVWPEAGRLEASLAGDAGELTGLVTGLTVRMLLTITALVIVMAAADFAWQRHAFTKKMMMTRQEVKDEQKDTEGSPEVRARLRAQRMEKASQRMMAAIPDAAVVIMNPTHFAVALAYEHGDVSIPVCSAKGTDELALRIRASAEEHGVPVVENPPLARALHAGIDIGEPIPERHYQAVATVISYVLNLAKKSPLSPQ
ncbi:MAG: EscU/YscU/HrcU family type III secretion system export apparatus switch protein [Pacificimonas sp.]